MRNILIITFFILCSLPHQTNAQLGLSASTNKVKNIRYSYNADKTRIVIDLDENSEFEPHFLEADPENNKPERIYVDILNTKIEQIINTDDINNETIEKVAYSQRNDHITRVVIYLKKFKDYDVFELNNPSRIVVDIKDNSSVVTSKKVVENKYVVHNSTNQSSKLIEIKSKLFETQNKFKQLYIPVAKAQTIKKNSSKNNQKNILSHNTKGQPGTEKIKKPDLPERKVKNIKTIGHLEKKRGNEKTAKKKVNDSKQLAKLQKNVKRNFNYNKSKIESFKHKLDNINYDSPEANIIADELLAIDTDSKEALNVNAWRQYNNKNYESAFNIFSKLHEKYPENKDYATGLIYSLIQLDQEDQATKVLYKTKISSSEKKKIESIINLRIGNKFYNKKDYQQAKLYFDRVLELDPDNEAAKSLNAWILTNTGKSQEALNIFNELYNKEKKPEIAEGIIINYEKLGNINEAIKFSKEIAKNDDTKFKRISSDYLSRNDLPITAAQINSDPSTLYHNADKFSFETTPYYRFKSGSSGTSELNEFSTPLSFSIPVPSGGNFKFLFISHYLDSGNSPSSPFVGTAPDGGPQLHDLETSLWVFTPQISFEQEGYANYKFDLGLTPLNADIDPLPTFSAEAKSNFWRINLHQKSVKESILSYVGLADPYGDREFGRVLRTGAEGELNFSTQSAYWLSIIGGYDYYWGKNVKSNNALNLNISIGRTIEKYGNDLSFGIFTAYKHFSRNLDFFTFGNGGYFSPENFIISGPTLRYVTKKYKTYWLDTQVSGGILYFKTENAPFFPRGDDSLGEFDGDSSLEFGFNVKMEALKLVNKHFEIGGFSSINRSSDFTEFIGGLKFKYFPSARNSIVSTQNLYFQ